MSFTSSKIQTTTLQLQPSSQLALLLRQGTKLLKTSKKGGDSHDR